MKVVLTGATGFVGQAVVKTLAREKIDYAILTRSRDKAQDTFPNAAGIYYWNPLLTAAPADAFRNCDTVIHLAGESIAAQPWTDEQKRRIFESRIKTTENLLETLTHLEQKPKTLISVSAIGFYGDREDEILDEGSAHGAGFLANTCYFWEKTALRAASSGIRTVILRLGPVLGKNGGFIEKILPIFRKSLGGRLGSGRQWMSWIHLNDLASLVVFALRKNSLSGIYNAVSPSPITNLAFTKMLGIVLQKPTLLRVPALALRLRLGEMADELLLASQRVSSEKISSEGFRFMFPEIESALKNSI